MFYEVTNSQSSGWNITSKTFEQDDDNNLFSFTDFHLLLISWGEFLFIDND